MYKLILYIILLYTASIHAQVNYTGNLVDNNWSNGYKVPVLTCWQAGDPACSPGTPYIRPDGNINFSYTATELYQARSLADVLPYSGTGLIVTGFQFNWRSKNGNGWDDGRLDTLQAYVQMYSKGGQWIEAQTYSLNFIHNWTDFSWSGNFTKERRNSDLGIILYGFYGVDNNYWMGPYGPEITNVSFILRYQPDPCVVNPLHSTECPGFMTAITKPIPGLLETTSYTTNVVTGLVNTNLDLKLATQKVQNTTNNVVEQTTTLYLNDSKLLNSVSLQGLQQLFQNKQRATYSSLDISQEQDKTFNYTKIAEIPLLSVQSNNFNKQIINKIDNTSNEQEQSTTNAGQLNTLTNTNIQTFNTKLTSRTQELPIASLDQDQGIVQNSTSINSTVNINQPANQTKNIVRNQELFIASLDQDQGMVQNSTTSTLIVSINQPTSQIKNIVRSQNSQNINIEQAESALNISLISTSIQLPQLSNKFEQKIPVPVRNDMPVEIDNIMQLNLPSTNINQSIQTNNIANQTLKNPNRINTITLDSEFNNQTVTIVKQPEIFSTQNQFDSFELYEKPSINLTSIKVNTPINTTSSALVETVNLQEPVRQVAAESIALDPPINVIGAALIDRNNPINSAINSTPVIEPVATFTGPSVKSNTKDNELAGEITISQIARLPPGFDVYTSLSIKEITFYQPREIYRGQRTVDNVKALQNLRSDRLHEQMMNQQGR